MSIQFTKAFVANGHTYATLEEAQIAAIQSLLCEPMNSAENAYTAAKELVNQSDAVIDILTVTASSRPAARKANGGTKKRKPKAEATPVAQPALV